MVRTARVRLQVRPRSQRCAPMRAIEVIAAGATRAEMMRYTRKIDRQRVQMLACHARDGTARCCYIVCASNASRLRRARHVLPLLTVRGERHRDNKHTRVALRYGCA